MVGLFARESGTRPIYACWRHLRQRLLAMTVADKPHMVEVIDLDTDSAMASVGLGEGGRDPDGNPGSELSQ